MTKVRIGMYYPEKLIAELDEAVVDHKYESRTALVLESVRRRLTELRKEAK